MGVLNFDVLLLSDLLHEVIDLGLKTIQGFVLLPQSDDGQLGITELRVDQGNSLVLHFQLRYSEDRGVALLLAGGQFVLEVLSRHLTVIQLVVQVSYQTALLLQFINVRLEDNHSVCQSSIFGRNLLQALVSSLHSLHVSLHLVIDDDQCLVVIFAFVSVLLGGGQTIGALVESGLNFEIPFFCILKRIGRALDLSGEVGDLLVNFVHMAQIQGEFLDPSLKLRNSCDFQLQLVLFVVEDDHIVSEFVQLSLFRLQLIVGFVQRTLQIGEENDPRLTVLLLRVRGREVFGEFDVQLSQVAQFLVVSLER